MAPQNYMANSSIVAGSTSNNSPFVQHQSFGALSWQRGRLKLSHINKSTSPPIFELRQQQQQQQQMSMSKRQQSDDCELGDLLRLTNLKLSDDSITTTSDDTKNSSAGQQYFEPSDRPLFAPRVNRPRIETSQVRSKMLMDGAGYHQLCQPSQRQSASQQHQPDAQVTLVSGGAGFSDAYFLPQQQAYYSHPTDYTNLEEISVFGGEHDHFAAIGQQHHQPSHQHQHHQQQQQQHNQTVVNTHQLQDDSPHIELLELDSRSLIVEGSSAALRAGQFSLSINSTQPEHQFKLSSCGAYLEPAELANDGLDHHHHHHHDNHRLVAKTETLLSAGEVLPESVIRLNEPQSCNRQQQHFSPQNSFSSQSVGQLSNYRGSTANNDNQSQLLKRSPNGTSSEEQTSLLEQSEFHVCEWEGCDNTFEDMQQFVKHLEDRHVNQNPREKNRYFCLWSNCKRNEQEFNARYKLLIHMRVHSGEKPYPCRNEDCKKTFSRLENLKIHQRSHTGEKPYKCSYENCSKSFTNSSDRIKHHKTHKDPVSFDKKFRGTRLCWRFAFSFVAQLSEYFANLSD